MVVQGNATFMYGSRRRKIEILVLFLHKFNPHGIICDENVVNPNAIEQVFVTSFLTRTILLANAISENVHGVKCLQIMWQKEKITLHSTIHFAMLTQPVNI